MAFRCILVFLTFCPYVILDRIHIVFAAYAGWRDLEDFLVMSDQTYGEDALVVMSATVNSLNKCWHVLRQTEATWNLKSAQQNIDKLRPVIESLARQWQAADDQLLELSSSIKKQLSALALSLIHI